MSITFFPGTEVVARGLRWEVVYTAPAGMQTRCRLRCLAEPLRGHEIVGGERQFLENGLILRTERGELVRSKSELVIADKLFAREVDYKYEQRLLLAGRESFPDFTIHDDARGVTFYWEHLGFLDDPGYAARWERKLAAYRANRILPHDEGPGEEGTLIITRDDPGSALDASRVTELIAGVLGQ